MIVDVRKMKDSTVDGYKFDDTGDYVFLDGDTIGFFLEDTGGTVCLCYADDLDNFIKALKLAKEMK